MTIVVVSGMTVDQAASALGADGVSLGVPVRVTDGTFPPDTVVGADPLEGTQFKAGLNVDPMVVDDLPPGPPEWRPGLPDDHRSSPLDFSTGHRAEAASGPVPTSAPSFTQVCADANVTVCAAVTLPPGPPTLIPVRVKHQIEQ